VTTTENTESADMTWIGARVHADGGLWLPDTDGTDRSETLSLLASSGDNYNIQNRNGTFQVRNIQNGTIPLKITGFNSVNNLAGDFKAHRGFRATGNGYGLGATTEEDLAGKTGNFVGELRLDDGTNTVNSGLYCIWVDTNDSGTGDAWQPLDGSSTFS
jgi:hypothetical protein